MTNGSAQQPAIHLGAARKWTKVFLLLFLQKQKTLP